MDKGFDFKRDALLEHIAKPTVPLLSDSLGPELRALCKGQELDLQGGLR